jgi:hypothetical protein
MLKIFVLFIFHIYYICNKQLKKINMENPFTTEKTRPTFLTVLCILTFIGSGWQFLSSLISIATSKIASSGGFMSMVYDAMNQSMEEIPEAMVKIMETGMTTASKILENGVAIGLTNTVLYAASILGAVLMFNLKKKGFYLYSAAQVLLVFVLPVIVGFNIFTVLGMIWALVFAAAFIIMYGVNVKHMN